MLLSLLSVFFFPPPSISQYLLSDKTQPALQFLAVIVMYVILQIYNLIVLACYENWICCDIGWSMSLIKDTIGLATWMEYQPMLMKYQY